MKKLLGLSLVFIALTPSAWAQSWNKKKQSNSPPAVEAHRDYASSEETSSCNWGLGIATTGSIASADTSLSALTEMGEKLAIQSYFTLAQTHDPFLFTVGGVLKYTAVGSKDLGLHLGGGVMVGTVSATAAGAAAGSNAFGFAIPLNVGAHFALPAIPRVIVSIDGGPILAVEDGEVNFSVKGYSSVLGLSVHYRL